MLGRVLTHNLPHGEVRSLESAVPFSGSRKERGDKGCYVVVRRIGIALTARARELKGHDIASPLIGRFPSSHPSNDLVDRRSIPKRVRSVEKVKGEPQRSAPNAMCDDHARDFLNTPKLILRHWGPNGGSTALWLRKAGNVDQTRALFIEWKKNGLERRRRSVASWLRSSSSPASRRKRYRV